MGESVWLAGDQVDGARRRRSELAGIAVVVHGVVLGIVPQRRDGVAVEVAHRQALGGDGGGRRQRAVGGSAAGGADPRREAVHVAVVVGGLLGLVVVALVRGRRLGRRQPERIGRIGAVLPLVVGRDGRGRIAVGIIGEQVDADER